MSRIALNYLSTVQPGLEDALKQCVQQAAEEQAANPIARVGELMLQLSNSSIQEPPTPTQSVPVPSGADQEKSSPAPQNGAATKDGGSRHVPSDLQRTPGIDQRPQAKAAASVKTENSKEWTAASFLASAHMESTIAEAIMADFVGMGELEAMRALGSSAEVEHLLAKSLRNGLVVEKLVGLLAPKLRELSTSQAASASELHSKFAADGGAFSLSYAGLSTFFGGLEAKIGTPKPNLDEAVHDEHCDQDDSQEPFTAENYGITTSSEVEYHFCASPDSTDFGEWPGERESVERSHRRRVMPLRILHQRMDEKNEQLKLNSEPLLMDIEARCARLYTGPSTRPTARTHSWYACHAFRPSR